MHFIFLFVIMNLYVENHKKLTGRTPVIIVDYAQIIAAADSRSTDKQNMDKNIVELKRISRDFNTPVIAISSFNRENIFLQVAPKKNALDQIVQCIKDYDGESGIIYCCKSHIERQLQHYIKIIIILL